MDDESNMPTQAEELIHAIRTRDYGRFEELLKLPGAVSARSKAGRTALHAAAEEGDLRAAEVLIKAGADPNSRTLQGQTPLFQAASYGGSLHAWDPDEDRRAYEGRDRYRPIHPAIAEVIRQIEKEKPPKLRDDLELFEEILDQDRIYNLIEMLREFSQALLDEIIARGFDVDRIDPDLNEFLRGNPRYVPMARLLIDAGAEVNAANKSGETPLGAAVQRGREEMVELLLSRGADLRLGAESTVDEPDALVWNALEHNNTKLAELLMRYGAPPPEQRRLHEAADNLRIKAMVWLIDKGININTRGAGGDTPLIRAGGHEDAVGELLKRGADFRIRNSKGETVLHTSAPWPKCLDIVLPLGLPIDEQNKRGRTPLHNAAQSGDWEGTQKLLAAGASPNIQDKDGRTPLLQQHEDLRTLLLSTGSAILVSDSNCENYWTERFTGGFNAIGKMLMDIRAELAKEKVVPRSGLEPETN